MASLLQHSTLIDILKHLLLPSCTCLTDNWWSSLVLAILDIGNGHWRIIFQMDIPIYSLVILVKYSTSDYYSWSQILWLLFLKADVVAQFLILRIVELLKSYTVFEFLKSEIIIELLPKVSHCCSRVPNIRYCSRLAGVKHWTKMLNTWPTTSTTALSAAKRCSR